MLDEFQAAPDSLAVSQEVESIMGPVKILIGMLRPFLARTGVTEMWLLAAVVNVLFMTIFLGKWLNLEGLWLSALDAVWSFGLSAAAHLPNVLDFVVGGVLLTGVTFVATRGASRLGKGSRTATEKVTGRSIKPRGAPDRGPSQAPGADTMPGAK